MLFKSRNGGKPLPKEFLEWQVALRRYTMEERQGAPHAGVAPLLTVRRAGGALGVTTHSIICGILPAPERLEETTREIRSLYEELAPAGAKAVYDRGLDYYRAYYRRDAGDFDGESLSTLLADDSPAVVALRADGRCTLVFYVFDLAEQSEVGRFRCLQLDCIAEVVTSGPVFDNVWWHNTLFHGKAEGLAVVRFRHQRTLDTRFGGLREVT